MLTVQHCRSRQKRLLDRLRADKLDAAVVSLPHHVYYFTSHLPNWLHHAAFILFADGRSWLTMANSPASHLAADSVVAYEANWMSTLRQEQPAVVAEHVVGTLNQRRSTRVAVDASAVASRVTLEFDGACMPLDPVLWHLRRQKDPDEIELMKIAIRCSEAMYRRAREIIKPGVPELEVFSELHATAVKTAGEPMSALLGNDFACGVPGGPARKDHAARAGEIYILDLGPTYRGYFADNCRAISVNRKPTEPQMRAWRAIMGVFPIVERMARPGVRCQEIFATADEHLRAAGYKGMTHHLGHGVGLQPHEYPHLNPKWDDTLMEGEIFTVEPGLYGPEIAGGIRLENQYLVTADGVVNLTPFPMELA